MSEESKSNEPAAPVPIGEIEHGPSKFDQFMEKNLKKLILLVLLIIIGVAAFVITSQLAEAKRQEAGNAYLTAESPEDYRKVISDYPDSAAASSAKHLLASQLWDEGNESEAIELLQKLVGSEETIAAQAKFTLAGMLLKQDKTAEAKSAYEIVLANSEAKYLHPTTLLALGDIANAAGEHQKAKDYYQRKSDDFPAYGDSNMAITRLNLVGVDKAKKVAPAPEPTADPSLSPSFTRPIPMQRPAEPSVIPSLNASGATEANQSTETSEEKSATAEQKTEDETTSTTPKSKIMPETPTFQEVNAEKENSSTTEGNGSAPLEIEKPSSDTE